MNLQHELLNEAVRRARRDAKTALALSALGFGIGVSGFILALYLVVTR